MRLIFVAADMYRAISARRDREPIGVVVEAESCHITWQQLCAVDVERQPSPESH